MSFTPHPEASAPAAPASTASGEGSSRAKAGMASLPVNAEGGACPVKLKADALASTLIVSAYSALKASKDPSFHRLRRASELLDAQMEPIFAQAVQRMKSQGLFFPFDNIACALLLLNFVDGSSSEPLGKALGSKDAGLSVMRFRQILDSSTPAELFIQVRRALQMLKGKASPFDVVRIALNWTENGADIQRRRLVSQFYSLPELEQD